MRSASAFSFEQRPDFGRTGSNFRTFRARFATAMRRPTMAMIALMLAVALLAGVRPAIAATGRQAQIMVSAQVVYPCAAQTSISPNPQDPVQVSLQHCQPMPSQNNDANAAAGAHGMAADAGKRFTLERIETGKAGSKDHVEYVVINF